MVLRGDIGGRCGPLLAGVGAWLAAPHAVTPTNTVVDVDLTTANGSRTGIIYTLSNAVNGSVTLLPDGHTARFTPTANFNGLASFAFSFNALGNTITQTFGVCVSNGIPVELKWVGATTAWDLATTANFTDAGAPSTFINGDAVTFDQTGTNTFTGGTSVSGGSLTLGNAAGAGTGPITMDNTTFNIGAFNVANAVTFSGTNTLVGAAFAKLTTMSGDGTFAGSIRDGAGGAAAISSVTKAGTATLAGASTYTGATLLSSGTLNVTGSLGSMTVTVADGATLMGTGTIAAATLFPGAALAPGDNSAATFTVNGDLTLSSGTALNFDLGTVSDRVNVTGNLALNGTLNITDLGGMAGTFTLFTYTGTLTGSGLTLGTAPAGSTYAVNTATPGLVRLIITPVSFLAWQRAYFTAAELGNTAISGPLSDANKDGEANLLEYATAQNPNGTTRATPTLVSNGATIEFTYIRSDAALADGVTFTVEWSDTLLNDWSKSGVSAPTVLSDNGTAQTVKVAVPFGAGGRRFVHLRVARP